MGLLERLKQLKHYDDVIKQKTEELEKLNKSISDNRNTNETLVRTIEFKKTEKEKIISERDNEIQKTKEACAAVIDSYQNKRDTAKEEFESAKNELDLTKKQVELNNEKIKLYKTLVNKITKSITDNLEFSETAELEQLCPTVELHLNSFDVKDLRSLINENKKITDKLLLKYEKRYTTKSNKAIYQLMVLALRAELQNIIINLKYTNLEKCKEDLNKIINKFENIASDGNQQIAPTIKSFIEEISAIFYQTIEIEYTYYVRREQEKAEQQALKEQMRQEAEERRMLELEQKKVEREEEKYKSEISNTKEMLSNCTDDEKMQQLLERIGQLEQLLKEVEDKKEEIINRQNGKAGYVYVISNLGSFGDNRFKIGMTRRLEPMERIKELGDASVPFSFDVHSFIFSDDAVNLEKELHTKLNENRTNKINLRKEFFDITIDELEKLVDEICPSAEFKRTMLATEYRKGLELYKQSF